jgi:ferredoxin
MPPDLSPTKRLRVRIDPDKCQGHNRCKAIAPELVDLDVFGMARARGDGLVPVDLEAQAHLAKSNCPEFAFDVSEE